LLTKGETLHEIQRSPDAPKEMEKEEWTTEGGSYPKERVTSAIQSAW